MSKKVSDLTRELDITMQELKDYATKMGIKISSDKDIIDDFLRLFQQSIAIHQFHKFKLYK